MTAPAVAKLTSLARCPVCGAFKCDELSYAVKDTFAQSTYLCGMIFVTANARIVVSSPCPAGSKIQADALNREIETASGGPS